MANGDLLTSSLYLFAVATLLVALSKRLGLGSILGLLIAGVIVGPYSPGPILTKEVEALRHITEFGVVLLLFVIGLEMQPKKLWSMRRDVFGLGSLQILFSGLLIFIYSLFFGYVASGYPCRTYVCSLFYRLCHADSSRKGADVFTRRKKRVFYFTDARPCRRTFIGTGSYHSQKR